MWIVRLALRRPYTFVVMSMLIVILGVVAVTLGFLMLNSERLEHDLALAEGTLQGMVAELQQALAEVRTLSGLLPICAHCKRIRDAESEWVRVEDYVEQRSAAQFSHGVCPECLDEFYPGLLDEQEMGRAAG